MNKLMRGSILACALLMLGGGEASAHEGAHGHDRQSRDRQGYDQRRDAYAYGNYRRHDDRRHERRHKRSKKMPQWLRHKRSFRHWLKATGLDRNRHMSWHRLYEIYVWDRSYRRYNSY